MPPVSSTSPVTGSVVPPFYIHSSSRYFRTVDGRTLLLRGINLAASAKTPVGQPGARLDGFWEHAKDGDMSFVGRVLDLDNGVADRHLERLRSWGFNCLRYVVNWESIEHKGPGQYDQEYIDYTVTLLRKCKEYGFLVYMDPHQDVWSRFSGGSGAPYWTLIACGLNPENFTVTNAAAIECEWPHPDHPDPTTFPAMIWASNYSRLAAQTLFTLWGAGRDYAPKCIINGVNIQDFLHEHYFNAIRQLGRAIADAGDLLDECVIGWDSLNEPNAGYIGIDDITQHGKESILKVRTMPTAFEGMRLAMGEAVEVQNWRFGSLGPKRDGSVLIDPKGARAWLEPDAESDGSPYGWVRGPDWQLGTCIWGLHGVWDVETREVLQADYFKWYRGPQPVDEARREVSYGGDYWLAHWRRYAPIVREFHPEAIHFIHTPVFQIPPKIEGPEIQNRAAYSTHFYDGLTLVTKHWNWFNADALGILRGKYASVVLGVKVGETAIRKCMRDQLAMLRQDTFDALGDYPTMMGEIGIPFDLDKKKAYQDGDYTAQMRALDASLNACDGANALNYTVWTYCPDNSHQWSDRWNGEDLSIWSPDDAERMDDFRGSNVRLDLVGRIPITRARAASKAGSIDLSRNNSSAQLSIMVETIAAHSSLAIGAASLALVVPTQGNGARLASSSSASSSQRESSKSRDESSPSTDSSSSPVPPFASQPACFPFESERIISLNDGARAIAAFCRPYPILTVGTPTNINFDIRSSKFSFEVELDSDEFPSDQDELVTEVFVPLIHYAAYPSRVSQLIQNDDNVSANFTPPSPANYAVYHSKRTPPAKNGYEADDLEARGAHHSLSMTELEDPSKLALKVKVSTGRWEAEGQRLKWYYPRPNQGKVTLKIEIEREKGAIPAWVNQWERTPNARGYCVRCFTYPTYLASALTGRCDDAKYANTFGRTSSAPTFGRVLRSVTWSAICIGLVWTVYRRFTQAP
ncbi:BQ2448_2436 [Microbotryum intermedium]|uniref:BQ2448_2436 protein n=1 Tax=Microbotryum intermedium TaxID=269621 RepID=A0A238FE93_9BASI|nr:BQ2448_2436 [Microbotryum intermedium]